MLQQRPPPTSFLSIHKAFTSYPYPWGDHISEKKTDTQQLLCAECHGHEEPGAVGSEKNTGTLLGLEVGWLSQICDILAEALGGE